MTPSRRGALAGFLLGVWCVAWLLLYRLAAISDLLLGSEVPARYRGMVFASLTLREELAIDAGVLIVPTLLCWLWCALEDRLRIDPDGHGRASVQFAIRSMLPWPAVIIGLLALVPYSSFAFFLATFVLPFVLLHRDAVGGDRVHFTRPHWPGFVPLLAALTCIAGAVLAAIAFTLIDEMSPAAGLALTPFEWILGAMFFVVAAEAFVFRMSPRTAVREFVESLQWRRIGPVIAMEARFMVLTAALIVPLIVVSVFLWKDIPVAAGWLGYQKQLPMRTAAFITFAHVVGDNGGMVLLFTCVMFGCLAFGRYACLSHAPVTDPVDPLDRPAESPAVA